MENSLNPQHFYKTTNISTFEEIKIKLFTECIKLPFKFVQFVGQKFILVGYGWI